MKQILTTLVVAVGFVQGAWAQYVNVHLTDSTVYSYALADISTITHQENLFEINFVSGDTLDWNFSVVDFITYEEWTADVPEFAGFDIDFTVYPNPSSGPITVEYRFPENERIQIQLFDLNGRMVSTLFDGRTNGLSNKVSYDGSFLASGPYLCVLTTRKNVVSKLMILTDNE